MGWFWRQTNGSVTSDSCYFRESERPAQGLRTADFISLRVEMLG
jgi:hypothetical protein